MYLALYHNLPSGGAKRTLYETVKRLAERHSIDVYTLSSANHDFCDIRPFVQHHYVYEFTPLRLFSSPFGRLNQLQRWRDLRRLNQLSRRIAEDIDRGIYNVVFVEPCIWTQTPLVLLYLETPTVYYCQEPPRHLYESDYTGGNSGWRHWLDHIDPLICLYRSTAKRLDFSATRAAKQVLVNSEFMRATIQEIYNIVPEVSYHGIDTQVYRPLNIERQQFLLSVGAIHRYKGFDFLIKSLRCLPEKLRPPLKLVGNVGVDREILFLESLAARLGVDLHIEVGVSQETLIRRYNEAALLVYAPYNEPFGLVPLEAMACGTPVVAVAEGGMKETILDGITGRLLPRDPNQFAQTIRELLKHPEERRRMGQEGIKYVQKQWSWEQAVFNIEQHLGSFCQ